jgi:formate-dependent nitrite reductase cytochrome c552 subunit
MVYEWKENTRIPADAQKVGEELESILRRDAEAVVELARKNKKSELHKCFEWDDTEAGKRYRLEQARHIMRMIVTEVDCHMKGKTETVTIRAFESVRLTDDSTGEREKTMVYVHTAEALADDDFREQIIGGLEDVIGSAERTAEKYSHIIPQFKNTKRKLEAARESVRV